ncbi:MAG: mannose-1-phosphate guanylyltransferase [Proteobacteria bacterium]|nr:mannose-1-phosphate guanylyltransferase [Pseudomonadota bacterium]
MNWAVIMAGGNGTRFWPLSSERHPKQFLKLIGDKTPTEGCLLRLQKVVPLSRILIVASCTHRDALHKALPDFPDDQILWEPIGRNTAPCIAWAEETIRARDPNAIIGVFPSDHDVQDVEKFASYLKIAFEAAHNRIVLFGIEPTRPETGYGYIEIGEKTDESCYKVASFREKPDFATAQSYLESGSFLWNSGMFIFDAQTMHDELSLFVPQILEGVTQIIKTPENIETIFPTLLSISIDYAIMEHTQSAVVIKASFPWDDLGTWSSICKYFPSDSDGNAVRGDARLIDCTHTFVYSDDGRTIAALGIHNVVIVSTRDAVLVMDVERSQDVRKVGEKKP